MWSRSTALDILLLKEFLYQFTLNNVWFTKNWTGPVRHFPAEIQGQSKTEAGKVSVGLKLKVKLLSGKITHILRN